ncbi:MAG: hypothetical protein DRJ30_05540 [Candidatus Methanomethylicota archaeon]|nr:MAG: hypothetical protein DRJ30_05540 [Candidatus Verstraetearchaeota archaeon]
MVHFTLDFKTIFSAFILISLAELADKTQIVTLILSTRMNVIRVFLGSFFGFTLVNILCMLLACYLNFFIPVFLAKLFSSLLFIVFGFLSLKMDSSIDDLNGGENSIYTIFLLVSSLELADKTNIAVLGLIWNGADLLSAFLGLILSGIIMMGSACILGCKMKVAFKGSRLQRISSIVFILIGVALLLEALLST